MGAAPRVALYVKATRVPDGTVVSAVILAVTDWDVPGDTTTVAGVVEVKPATTGLATTAHVNVELPHGVESAFRRVRVTVADDPRDRTTVVGAAVSDGVPRTQPAGDVGVGDGDAVAVAVGVGVGVGVAPAAAATARAASTIPAPQPGVQPPAASGCAVCCMSDVTWAGVSDGLTANMSAATAETCGVAMLVPEYRAYDGTPGPCVPELSVDHRLTPGAEISTAEP